MIPVRDVSGHYNILSFLETGPCYDCVQVTGISNSGYGTKLVDLQINHPFSSLNLTGFDVRGIAMFNSSWVFSNSVLGIPDHNMGTGELINPEGFTTLYNMYTEGSGPGGLEGYTKGNFAAVITPNASLNGFIRFNNPGPGNDRFAFYPETSETRTYDLYFPTGQFIFGYAIDACWAPPSVTPVTDPQVDFPPNANCSEPRFISYNVVPLFEGLDYEGGQVTLEIFVADHQGKDSYSPPRVECEQLFNGFKMAEYVQDGMGFSQFNVTIINELLAPAGDYKLLISVEDHDNSWSPPWLNLTMYQVVPLTVLPEHGWARTFGGANGKCNPQAVEVDDQGNLYIVGGFQETVDLSPGPSVTQHTSNGIQDSFILKLDPDGMLMWSHSWGSYQNDTANDVLIAPDGTIFVTGSFEAVTDFNPGPGEDFHDYSGTYLANYTPDGNYINTLTWDATIGLGLAADNDGNIYVCGRFSGITALDFDPGPADALRFCHGGTDAWFSKFNSAGIFQNAITWGAEDFESALNIEISEELDAVLITGYFGGTVDFEPGAGNDWEGSNGGSDAYLLSFNTDLTYNWVNAWGGTSVDQGSDVCAIADRIFTSGEFSNTVDFNPSIYEEDEKSSLGQTDGYLNAFEVDDTYIESWIWGGVDIDNVLEMTVNASGDILICGNIHSDADLDPSDGTDPHFTSGLVDTYVLSHNPVTGYNWAVSWGGEDASTLATGITHGANGYSYVVGSFDASVDFNPGSGENIRNPVGDPDGFVNVILPDGSY